MQAEVLVLVDVLHRPSLVFPKHSVNRCHSFDTFFIGRLIRHFKFLLDEKPTKSDEMCIDLIQILRKMVFHESFKLEDKTVMNKEAMTYSIINQKQNNKFIIFIC
jgi:hypothetical protein